MKVVGREILEISHLSIVLCMLLMIVVLCLKLNLQIQSMNQMKVLIDYIHPHKGKVVVCTIHNSLKLILTIHFSSRN